MSLERGRRRIPSHLDLDDITFYNSFCCRPVDQDWWGIDTCLEIYMLNQLGFPRFMVGDIDILRNGSVFTRSDFANCNTC